jgi:hypothetical protein
MMSMPFVGREDLLGTIDAELSSDSDLVIEVIEGLHGTGKTTLLRELRGRVGRDATFLDMEDYDFRERTGEHASSALQSSYFQYKEFLLELAKLGGGLDGFESSVNRAWRKVTGQIVDAPELTQQSDRKAELSNANQSVAMVTLAGKVNASSWRNLAEEITDAFISRWEVWSTGQRARTGRNLLIALDNYDAVLRDEVIRDWIRSLGSRMCNVVLVAARVPSETQLAMPQGAIEARRLPNFTPDEVRRCLEGRLDEPVSPEVVEQVHRFTEGHPQMVGLLCDLVFESELGSDPTELRAQLRRLPREPAAKVTDLVRKILQHPENPDQLVKAASAACVLREFKPRALAALLDDDDADVDPAALVNRLSTYTITETLTDEIGGDSYRLRAFIRRWLRKDLFDNSEDKFFQLHRRAADFYFGQLVTTQAQHDTGKGAYGEWRRYDDPSWLSLKRDWLYYLVHAGPAGRDEAHLQFARLFLDAFWWWGCYLPFKFCSTIIDDLKEVLDEDDATGHKLAENLSKVLDHYPHGSDKPKGPHWKIVRAALKNVIDACGLRHPAQRTTPEQRHVFGLCSVFLAHSYLFDDDVSSPKIDQYYDDAAASFEEAKDHWSLGFVAVERADVALARDDVRRALERANDAAALASLVAAEDRPDEELNTNIERVRADALWMHGQRPTAVDYYCSAVTHAYLFQNQDERSGPDRYTRTFYDEQLGWLALRLEEAAAEGDESELVALRSRVLAAPLAGRISTGPTPESLDAAAELRAGECLQFVHQLFPPGPTEDVLNQNDSSFVAEWQEYEERVDSSKGVDLVVMVDEEVDAPRAG